MTEKIDEIIKETKDKYGINIRIILTKKKKKEKWIFESLDKSTNSKVMDEAKIYAAHRLSESQYIELLDRSNSDIKASRILYGNGLYPEAVYFLQQSIEKAAKSLVVLMRDEPFTEKEFIKIGHKAIEIYKDWAKTKKKVYENIKKNSYYKKIIDLEVDINNELNSANNFLSALSKIETTNEKDLISVEIETESIFKKYEDFENQENNWEKLRIYLLKSLLLYGIDIKEKIKIENFFEKLRNVNGFEKLSQKLYIVENQVHTCLPLLLIHTLAHEALTRYPKADLSITPKVYNEQLPIVKKFDDLADFQNKISEKLKEFYELKKKFSVILETEYG